MIIGAFLMVRDEETVIEANLRYHLDQQGLDRILVVDNGSVDRTVEIVKSLGDKRIVLRRTPPEAGYRQNLFSSQAAMELFERFECDWVLPVDADEFWVSDRYGTVRNAMASLPDDREVSHTWAYNFFETDRDDPEEPNFLRRLTYFRMSRISKVVLYRRVMDKFEGLVTGNHDVLIRPDADVQPEMVEPTTLVRYHYPYISRAITREKVRKQVDGFLRAFGTSWLEGEPKVGTHILKWHKAVEDGSFEELYRSTAFLTDAQIQDRAAKHPVHRSLTMRNWFR